MRTWEPTRPRARSSATGPLPGRRLEAPVLALPALIALVLYAATRVPGLVDARAVDLALAAHRLGMAHEPAPLFTVVAFPFARLASDPVLGTSVLTLLVAVALVGSMTALAYRLTHHAVGTAFAATLFVLTPALWCSAVVTSTRAWPSLLLACALMAARAWRVRPGRVRGAIAGATLAALGSSLAMGLAQRPMGLAGGVEAFGREVGGLSAELLSSVFWVGGLAAWLGIARAWRRDRALSAALLLVLAGNVTYVALTPGSGSGERLLPALLSVSVLASAGVARAWSKGPRVRGAVLACAAVVAVVAPARERDRLDAIRTASAETSAFANRSFGLFPERALVVAAWDRAVLLRHAQLTRAKRPDVEVLERTDATEIRPFGRPGSWRAHVVEEVRRRPVVVDTREHGLGLHDAVSLDAVWHRLVPGRGATHELPGTASRRPPPVRSVSARDPGSNPLG